MPGAVNLSKLAELRVRTDRDLVKLIDDKLELGLQSRLQAEKAYAEVLKVLPAVDNLMERQRLEKKLERFEDALDGLSRPGERRVQTTHS